MQAAAEDLDVDLKIVYSKSNSYSHKKDGLKALNDADKPDYFITGYWNESSSHHVKHAEKLGIRTFIINSGVVPGDRTEIGRPREKHRYWMGQMIPDDQQAGYMLADILIRKTKAAGKTDDSGKVHLIAIGGMGEGIESEEKRYKGLKKRVAEQNDAVLDEFILAGWSPKTAYTALLDSLKQLPETGAIWSASDAMALGAVEATKSRRRTPGRDIFIGGMDWSLEGLEAVKTGEMAVSMGGHFLEGVKALILIHDHHNGLDFASELGVEIQTQMTPITTENAEKYLNTLNTLDWHNIDFRQFSKKHNPKLKSYDLSLEALLKSLKPPA